VIEKFTCPKCSSQSAVYPAVARDDDYVTCRGRSVILATLVQFRRLLSKGTRVSGC
jgi:hypothetical protein